MVCSSVYVAECLSLGRDPIPEAAESWFADRAMVASLPPPVPFTDGHPFLLNAADNRTSFL